MMSMTARATQMSFSRGARRRKPCRDSLLVSSLAGRVSTSSQAVCARVACNARSLMMSLSSILIHGNDVLDVAVLQVQFLGLVNVPVILQHKFQQFAHFEQRRWLRRSSLSTWWFSLFGTVTGTQVQQRRRFEIPQVQFLDKVAGRR